MSSSKKRRDISKANEAKRQAEIAKGFAEGEVTIWKTGAEIMQHELTQLRTELAATQLQLKEAREALEYANQELRGMLEPECKNYYDSSIIGQALSRPADTTALNRYVAEELDFAVERVITLYEGDEPPYLVDICKAIKDWNAKKKLCNQYWKFSRGI